MAKDFSKSETELWGVVDTLLRAISIIQGEMAKNPAFSQKKNDTRNLNNVVAALHCSSRCGSVSRVGSGTATCVRRWCAEVYKWTTTCLG